MFSEYRQYFQILPFWIENDFEWFPNENVLLLLSSKLLFDIIS